MENETVSKQGTSRNKRSFEDIKVVEKLATRPGKLTKQDVLCAICWDVLIEPTTLPCNHSVCKGCLLHHLNDTSLVCPCCRRRISIWCRMNCKSDSLVDEELWKRIQEEFPNLVQARLANQDEDVGTWNEQPECELDFGEREVLRDGEVHGASDVNILEFYEMNIFPPHIKDLELARSQQEAASLSLAKELTEEEVRKAFIKTESRDNDKPSSSSSSSSPVSFVEEINQIVKPLLANFDAFASSSPSSSPRPNDHLNESSQSSPRVLLELSSLVHNDENPDSSRNSEDESLDVASSEHESSYSGSSVVYLSETEPSSIYPHLEVVFKQLEERHRQEVADRAYAINLQRRLNMGLLETRGRGGAEEYSLRSWKRDLGRHDNQNKEK